MVYKRRGRPSWTLKVRTRTGWQQLGSGTTSKALAERMSAMWEQLALEYRAWDILEPVLKGKLAIDRLYDLWVETKYTPAEVRRQLADSDLEPLVADFLTVYASRGRAKGSVQNVTIQLRHLLPEGETYLASKATPDALTTALARYPGRASTRRKVHSSWSVFFDYATKIKGLFGTNPMLAVQRPGPEKTPIKFYELADVERIVKAAPTPAMGALWSLMYATGIEISVALLLTRGDFDTKTWEVRARGTKTHTRDRVCLVAEWARPALEAFLKDKVPAAPLWPKWNRWTPTDVHTAQIRELKDPPLHLIPLRNSRHHWAARAARAGTPIAVIQAQLGHANPMLTLSLYGRFTPRAEDREAWEAKATAGDQARRTVESA